MSDFPKRSLYYIMKNGKPVPADFDTIDAFLQDRTACLREVTYLDAPGEERVIICTIFTGLALIWYNDLPLLWETVISWEGRKELDNWKRRYTSEEDARAGHHEAVALTKATINRLRRLSLN